MVVEVLFVRVTNTITHYNFHNNSEEGFRPSHNHSVKSVGWVMRETTFFSKWKRHLYVLNKKGKGELSLDVGRIHLEIRLTLHPPSTGQLILFVKESPPKPKEVIDLRMIKSMTIGNFCPLFFLSFLPSLFFLHLFAHPFPQAQKMSLIKYLWSQTKIKQYTCGSKTNKLWRNGMKGYLIVYLWRRSGFHRGDISIFFFENKK